MPKCDFDNSIEIKVRHRCSPVNLLHIQTGKNEKYFKEGEGVGAVLATVLKLILTKAPKNTYLQGWVM